MPSKNDALTDSDLITLYREKGDIAHLGILYDRYIHLVYGLALKYLKSREDAQDAVMNIFEKIKDPLFEKEILYFKSWLYTVSRNYCLIRMRRMNNSVILTEDVVENVSDVNLNDEAPMEQDLKALQNCMKDLKENQKACVEKFFLEKHNYQQVSEATGYTLKQVKSYIQNGKRNLKNCIEAARV